MHTHFWHVRVEFHSSVDRLHRIHLRCAQPPPRRRLRRESEKQRDRHPAIGTTAWASAPKSARLGPREPQRAEGVTSPSLRYAAPLGDRPLGGGYQKAPQKQKACVRASSHGRNGTRLSGLCLNANLHRATGRLLRPGKGWGARAKGSWESALG